MEQPSLDIQIELGKLADNKPDIVKIPYTNRNVKIYWIKRRTLRCVTEVLNDRNSSQKNESKITCKAMAYLVLNDFWKIKFFYPFLWRWYFYIRQYNDYQCLKIIEIAKKKAPLTPYYLSMVFLNGLKDTLALMTREEVNHIHQKSLSDNKE